MLSGLMAVYLQAGLRRDFVSAPLAFHGVQVHLIGSAADTVPPLLYEEAPLAPRVCFTLNQINASHINVFFLVFQKQDTYKVVQCFVRLRVLECPNASTAVLLCERYEQEHAPRGAFLTTRVTAHRCVDVGGAAGGAGPGALMHWTEEPTACVVAEDVPEPFRVLSTGVRYEVTYKHTSKIHKWLSDNHVGAPSV